ncbi:MAG: HlyD family efflux transporter periplasmic adaptor subunit [Patescibacteria group bacterium]|nr:HlyD family efflux transporter periplasmic adaptor subunit [Patescibacteria group bacterium]MDE2437933.1 HlyD family efflux transporter periplasmic adaptor subunit [Patescibacteria group bacterium]
MLPQEEHTITPPHYEHPLKRLSKNAWVLTILISLLFLGSACAFAYLSITHGVIYTDNADIEAPLIELAPQNQGILQNIYVHEGDVIDANTIVAQVGNELLQTTITGIVSSVNVNTGKLFNRGETVVSMFDPHALRVVGHIDEDKGISHIRIGARATFTVDAFGSKRYEGIVDEISPSSRQGDIVFNISDKREVKQFDVKIRFDTHAYPELKNGMSAKIWISP